MNSLRNWTKRIGMGLGGLLLTGAAIAAEDRRDPAVAHHALNAGVSYQLWERNGSVTARRIDGATTGPLRTLLAARPPELTSTNTPWWRSARPSLVTTSSRRVLLASELRTGVTAAGGVSFPGDRAIELNGFGDDLSDIGLRRVIPLGRGFVGGKSPALAVGRTQFALAYANDFDVGANGHLRVHLINSMLSDTAAVLSIAADAGGAADYPTLVYQARRDQYLLAWETERDIRVRVIPANGSPPPPETVIANRVAALSATRPPARVSLAYDALSDQYLLAWRDGGSPRAQILRGDDARVLTPSFSVNGSAACGVLSICILTRPWAEGRLTAATQPGVRGFKVAYVAEVSYSLFGGTTGTGVVLSSVPAASGSSAPVVSWRWLLPTTSANLPLDSDISLSPVDGAGRLVYVRDESFEDSIQGQDFTP